VKKIFIGKSTFGIVLLIILALLLTSCSGDDRSAQAQPETSSLQTENTISFALETGIADGRLVFIGQGGEIEGIINPDLLVSPGDTVEITLVNGDGPEHDIVIPELDVESETVQGVGTSTTITFVVEEEGEFIYLCSIPGHQAAGMEGRLISGELAETGASDQAVSIVRDPADLPPPLERRSPQTIKVALETVELDGFLAEGVTYTYWTFDGKVPGPFIRVMQGDTVEISLSNLDSSRHTHSIDLHAVTGPGGGAVYTQVSPGGEKSFTFKALQPGLYVYHCATPMVAHHIANGMYGLILVEPEGGLPSVDREFYIMQGEIYTDKTLGQRGHLAEDIDKLLAEAPEYFVFNGAVGGLTHEYPLQAQVGETVRIFFGVGGPNFVSSFHVIGEIFDQVYGQASLTSAPLTDVQTTLVPPGGATLVEFTLDVPGNYVLVDHALSRLERGLVGFLTVTGEDNPEILYSDEHPDTDGH
jgi:nitrite reductase (NO-forming)